MPTGLAEETYNGTTEETCDDPVALEIGQIVQVFGARYRVAMFEYPVLLPMIEHYGIEVTFVGPEPA